MKKKINLKFEIFRFQGGHDVAKRLAKFHKKQI